MKPVLLSLTVILVTAVITRGQQVVRQLPDQKLTPGDTLSVTDEDVCKPDYQGPTEKLTVGIKGQVFDRYGIKPDAIGYNVDHLIPEALGGSNSIKNLWPQPLQGEWNYHMKNRLEDRLRKLVCSKQLPLKDAQREIAADWVGAYKKYVVKVK